MIQPMPFPLAMHDATMPDTSELDHTISLMGEDEFRAFYERTARPLWAYLLRVTGDSHKAEDALQEAYYRFYRAGTQYSDESHRRNSLFRIATNIVRDSARRAKYRDHLPLAEDLDAAARQTDPTLKTDLARAMNQLEPVQREMLWLAYAQGASHEEIGNILGLRAVSIRTLLLRARRKLASILEPAR